MAAYHQNYYEPETKIPKSSTEQKESTVHSFSMKTIVKILQA